MEKLYQFTPGCTWRRFLKRSWPGPGRAPPVTLGWGRGRACGGIDYWFGVLIASLWDGPCSFLLPVTLTLRPSSRLVNRGPYSHRGGLKALASCSTWRSMECLPYSAAPTGATPLSCYHCPRAPSYFRFLSSMCVEQHPFLKIILKQFQTPRLLHNSTKNACTPRTQDTVVRAELLMLLQY